VTPDDLRGALLTADGEAIATCRAALDDPSATVRADWDALASTANLLTIYRRRASHVHEIGLPTLGFEEIVQRLETTPYMGLRLAVVEIEGRHLWCVIFLAPDEPKVVGALAVTGPMPLT